MAANKSTNRLTSLTGTMAPFNVSASVRAFQRCLLVLAIFGLLIGTAVGVWFLVKQLLKPLHLQESLPHKDPEAVLTKCTNVMEEREADQETPFGNVSGKKVFFRVDRSNFLLEVQVEGRSNWLLLCHENWEISLGMQICRQMGHVRLTHHKGVNLTDVKVNSAQEFAHVLPNWKGSTKDMWQVRSRCSSGRIVALKCSECGSRSKASQTTDGKDAPLRGWPWQVSLYLAAERVCTGSVVSHKWIITAAHCMDRHLQLSSWAAFVGLDAQASVEGRRGAVLERVVPHPRYDNRNHDYDIAMLKLREPLHFSDTVQAACLPPYHADIPNGSTCWISGWDNPRPENEKSRETLIPVLKKSDSLATLSLKGIGKDGNACFTATIAEMPKEGQVTLISTQNCNSSCRYAGELTPRMLCAYYMDGNINACKGESGRSLVCQHEHMQHLVGIGSWGAGCGKPESPGVYTKVAAFLDWIHHVITHSEDFFGGVHVELLKAVFTGA
ncbi:transmembrane protease serine 5 [Elgaria multicarinata webbii]|uniref:transmembrane protease serine 5 n=1 Tax=Elgaria multicarinata webbii TaxID=159646 RepID=UPI002FCD1E5D